MLLCKVQPNRIQLNIIVGAVDLNSDAVI